MTSQRNVHFSGQDEVFPTMGRQDYSEEEKKATWMYAEDFKQIKEAIKEILVLFIKGDAQAHTNSESYCTRGLETITPGNARRIKKSSRFEVKQNVLAEQHHQYTLRNCIYNPERLAEICGLATEETKIAARVYGIMDAESVFSDATFSTRRPLKPFKYEMARAESIFNDNATKRQSVVVSYAGRAA
mmetsp:Transcript_12221/g.19660  ORF Transcript_12221/g.19660 Transcript_12221/m.19660 type:complete len:187 (+) Transcript_12221:89-649(+)